MLFRSREVSTNPLWQQAMADELDALHKSHTWDMTTLPSGKSAVGCKWVYKIKTRVDGSVKRYKARLVNLSLLVRVSHDYLIVVSFYKIQLKTLTKLKEYTMFLINQQLIVLKINRVDSLIVWGVVLSKGEDWVHGAQTLILPHVEVC